MQKLHFISSFFILKSRNMSKYFVTCLFLLIIFVISTSSQIVGHEDFEDYDLTWTISGDKIRFRSRVKTGGWVGVGLNTKAGMDGAELMIAGVTKGPDVTTVTPTTAPSTTTTTLATTTLDTTTTVETETTTTAGTTTTLTTTTEASTETTTTPTPTTEATTTAATSTSTTEGTTIVTTTTSTTDTPSTQTTITSVDVKHLQLQDQPYEHQFIGGPNNIAGPYLGSAWTFQNGIQREEMDDDDDDDLPEIYTTVEWERDLTTSDGRDVQIVRGQRVYLLMAYGISDDHTTGHTDDRRDTELIDLFNPSNSAISVGFGYAMPIACLTLLYSVISL